MNKEAQQPLSLLQMELVLQPGLVLSENSGRDMFLVFIIYLGMVRTSERSPLLQLF